MFFLLEPLNPRIPIKDKTIAIMPKTIPVKPAKINPTIASIIATIPNTSATPKLAIIKTSFLIYNVKDTLIENKYKFFILLKNFYKILKIVQTMTFLDLIFS